MRFITEDEELLEKAKEAGVRAISVEEYLRTRSYFHESIKVLRVESMTWGRHHFNAESRGNANEFKLI